MKKSGFNPFILMSDPTPVPTATVIGGGSGQGGVNPVVMPISYDEWRNSPWAEDYVLATKGIDWVDYVVWFFDAGFTMEQFTAANPGVSWDPNWDNYL